MSTTRNTSPLEPARCRHVHAVVQRALDTASCVTAAAVAVFLLSTDCAKESIDTQSNVAVKIEEGDTEEDETGTDSATVEGDSGTQASGTVAATNLQASIAAIGPSTRAEATEEIVSCFEASGPGDLALNMFFSQARIDIFCPDGAGSAQLAFDLTAEVDGGSPIRLHSETASIGCSDTSVTSSGILTWAPSIPTRFFGGGDLFRPDILPVQQGTRIEVSATMHVLAFLGDQTDGSVKLSARPNFFLTAGNASLSPVPCQTEPPCASNDECSAGKFCIGESCHAPIFDPSLHIVTHPGPIISGQSFDTTINVRVGKSHLFPHSIEVVIADGGVNLNGALTPGIIVGGCGAGSLTTRIVASGADAVFADEDANSTAGPLDPTATVTENTSGDTVVRVTFPDHPSALIVPPDTTASCTLNTLFIAGPPGEYAITVTAESVSVAGLPRFIFTQTYTLVVPTECLPSTCHSVCGDGNVAHEEQCDDGNTVSGDGCSPYCVAEYCGDGIITHALDEECDDANVRAGDGCSDTCGVEHGYECTGEPSVCTPILGQPSDANCDGGLGAADLVKFSLLIPGDEQTSCGSGDVTGDGHVREDDRAAAINATFGAR